MSSSCNHSDPELGGWPIPGVMDYWRLDKARMGPVRSQYPKNDRKTIPDKVMKNNWIHATCVAI